MADGSYNNYSQELLKFFPEIKPNSGKSLRFQIANTYTQIGTGKFICPTSANVLPVDRILDPGKGGEAIDIAYITGKRPLGPNSPRAEEIITGDITFTRGNMGMYEWFGEPHMKDLARYLFFCNANESNADKPWHIKPTHYIIKNLGNEEAVDTLASARKLDRAFAKIEEIAANPQVMATVKVGMFPNDHARFSDEQIVLKLRQIASTPPDGADMILRLSAGPDMKANASVHTFVKDGLIRYNETNSLWEYPDGRLIINVGEEQNSLQALKEYFLSDDGKVVFDTIIQLSQKAPKKK